LNFSFQVLTVKDGDKESIAISDPIGNVIDLSTHRYMVNSKGYVIGGHTEQSKFITIPADADGMAVAHEIGHTFLGLGGGDDDEHVDNTIMDKGDIDAELRINKEFVEKVSQTYGLSKNPHPVHPSLIQVTRDGKTETIQQTENFRIRNAPDVSNEEIIKQLSRTVYDPKQ